MHILGSISAGKDVYLHPTVTYRLSSSPQNQRSSLPHGETVRCYPLLRCAPRRTPRQQTDPSAAPLPDRHRRLRYCRGPMPTLIFGPAARSSPWSCADRGCNRKQSVRGDLHTHHKRQQSACELTSAAGQSPASRRSLRERISLSFDAKPGGVNLHIRSTSTFIGKLSKHS